jgi:tRNA(Ile)-lysidine synthase
MVKKVLQTIFKYKMIKDIDAKTKILVALSGGADSVCLLYILNEISKKYDLQLECAHINHKIRGEDSEKDQKFVESLCNMLGMKLHILEKDVLEYAKINSKSVEDAGREVRYDFLNRVAKDDMLIATAHTKDDNAETVLINILKGNMPLGIPNIRGNIIRPLIETTKKEIYSYLGEHKLDFTVDKTNFSNDYFRNKVRLELIPKIEQEFNTNFTNTIYNTTDILQKENDFLEALVSDFMNSFCDIGKNEITTPILELKKLNEAILRRLIRRLFYTISSHDTSISYSNILDVLQLINKAKTGKEIELPNGVVAQINYDKFIITTKKITEKECYSYEINLQNNKADIKECNLTFVLSQEPLDIEYKYLYKVKSENLIIRNFKSGDKIYLERIKGHKKLSDIFINKKIPKKNRCIVPIVLENNNIIIITGIEENTSGNINLYIGENIWI